jgi:hypothetical protein
LRCLPIVLRRLLPSCAVFCRNVLKCSDDRLHRRRRVELPGPVQRPRRGELHLLRDGGLQRRPLFQQFGALGVWVCGSGH